MDSNGEFSEQIDIVIFDRQYSPYLANEDGHQLIPIESVYAVAEVKQEISKKEVKYAGQKISSVRKLIRTSAPITHAGGTYHPKSPYKILSIFLALKSSWVDPLGKNFEESIGTLTAEQQIDLGCILQNGAFLVDYSSEDLPIFYKSKEDHHLIFFFFNLLAKLQTLGTVPAADYSRYAQLTYRN